MNIEKYNIKNDIKVRLGNREKKEKEKEKEGKKKRRE